MFLNFKWYHFIITTYWPSAVQAQKTWLEYLSGALGWAHRVPGGTERVRLETQDIENVYKEMYDRSI